MNLFRVPLTVGYQIPNCSTVAPDGTLLYMSYYQLVCMRQKDGKLNSFCFEAGSKLQAIDCDPDFSRTRYVAASYEDKHVYIWDLDKKVAVFGHAAHVEKAQHKNRERDAVEQFPITFTLNKKVVSASKNRLVVYCVASNTYKVNTELVRKHSFTILKASPYNSNLVAGGTKDGLVVIFSLKNLTITHTMRGHDTEIRSLDWTKAPQTPVEEEDLFGLYSCNDPETEFGVMKESRNDKTFDMDEPSIDKTMHEAIENMNEEAFDFAEACQALKQDIIASKDDKSVEETKTTEYFDFADVVESQKCVTKAHSDSFSEASEAPSRDNDFKSVENDGDDNQAATVSSKSEEKDEMDLIILLSVANEPSIWLWNTQKGCALDKIHLPSGNSNKNSLKVKSFAAKWLNPFNIISNDQTGALCLWDIEYQGEAKISIHKSKRDFNAKAIAQITVDRTTENFWGISYYSHITCYNVDSIQSINDYTTNTANTYDFAVNPVDPNVVAIAGYKRISLLNVSKMSSHHFVMNNMYNNLHNQVLTLAWHPEKENTLAFGTREGTVGIFDTSKLHNSPMRMKPFFSKDVYSVTWGKFRVKASDEITWTLFCSGFTGNSGQLVYFPQQGHNKFAGVEVKQFKNVTAVVASMEYLAIGLYDGTVHLVELSDSSLSPFHTFKCGTKLISGFSFSGQKLAIASFDHQITICDIISKTQIKTENLQGHTGGVTNISWSLTKPDLLVSCGNDCSIRVWKTKERECEAVAKFEREVYTAIFHPREENSVLVAGHDFMMTIFDYKKETPDYTGKSIKNGAKPAGVTMAVANETDVPLKARKEKRKHLEIQKRLEKGLEKEVSSVNGTEDVIHGIEEMKLDEKLALDSTENIKEVSNTENPEQNTTPRPIKEKKEKTTQLNFTSIFFLTPRELNRDPIGLLKTLVSSKENEKHTRHQQLFSSDLPDVRSLLNEEHSHQIASNVQSVGHLTLPMLTMDIKSVIIEKISSKTLTEEYIAVAPFISYAFWRDTCLAYAHQCVEQGLVLKAISYFLCCYETNQAIAILCQSNHFTEAMAIAKMRKSEGDSTFWEIVTKWTSYLEYCGNFEAAAIVWMTYGNKDHALKVLERRSNPSEELQEVIQILKNTCDSKQET